MGCYLTYLSLTLTIFLSHLPWIDSVMLMCTACNRKDSQNFLNSFRTISVANNSRAQTSFVIYIIIYDKSVIKFVLRK